MGPSPNTPSLQPSRSTGSVDPWLVGNMRDGEAYGSWVSAAESPCGAVDHDGRVPKSAAQYSVGLNYLYASCPGRLWPKPTKTVGCDTRPKPTES
jgi:hypothetical protein